MRRHDFNNLIGVSVYLSLDLIYDNLFSLFAKKSYENNENWCENFRENENWSENFRENENFYEHLRQNFTFGYNNILTRLFHNFWAEIFATIFAKTTIDAKMFAKKKIFAKEISRTFAKNTSFSHDFRFLRKWKNVFVSTLAIIWLDDEIA
jgi:hypothetical protein